MDVPFREHPLGVYHKLTRDEASAVREAGALRLLIAHHEKKLRRLNAKLISLHDCEARGHICGQDEPGHPYDTRRCLFCGHVDLI